MKHILAALMGLIIMNPVVILAWQENGVVICDDLSLQSNPVIASDDVYGAIITWVDHRGGSYDIYAQRVDSSGVRLWTPENGVVICDTVGTQKSCKIVSDGSSGAIITWRNDNSDWNIYAQRVNSLGERQWSPLNGVLICVDDFLHSLWHYETIASSSGEAIIVWKDTEGGGAPGIIYAQKVNSSGILPWGSSSKVVSNASEYAKDPIGVADGSGGAIIVWWDERAQSPDNSFDIYAQKINSDGNRQWGTTDLCICNNVYDQQNSSIVSDGSGGAIITWDDDVNGNGSYYEVFAQRVNSSGMLEWDLYGVCICDEISLNPEIVSDGSGGAIIVWQDYRSSSNLDIYAQKVNSSGISQWEANGICICNAVGNQTHHKIIADGPGGAIITWDDERDGRHDIYAQRIDGDGNIHSGWDLNGVPVCDITNSGFTGIHPQIVTDGLGGTIITWRDLRNPDNNGDVYAQRITSEVYVGVDDTPEYQIRVKLYQNYPNPFNPKTIISYSLPKASDVKIMIYNIKGELIETLVESKKPFGYHTIDWNAKDIASGIYFYKLQAGENTFIRKMIQMK